MSKSIAPVLASGTIFGAALTASGVWYPSAVVAQMHLETQHVLKVFLTASATSAVAFWTLKRVGWVNCAPRKPSRLGWLGKYDGNIIGGLILGIGMTLSGACPGTVLVQVAMGVPSGLWALAGASLGGIYYTAVAKSMRRNTPIDDGSDARYSVQEKLNVDSSYVLLVFEVLAGAVITVATKLSPHRSRLLHPVTGGLVIGGGQLASLLLTKTPVGVSSAYEDLGRWFWYILRRQRRPKGTNNTPPVHSLIFATGIVLGSWILAQLRPGTSLADNFAVSPVRAAVGGAFLAFGARMGGGCNSGHGISGMSMFSVASIISVISMFAGGFGSAVFL